MHVPVLSNQHWVLTITLNVLLAATMTVSANAVTPEIPTISDNENEFMLPLDEKDEFVDVYSPWSKRSAMEEDISTDMMPIMVFIAKPNAMEDLIESDNMEMNDDNISNQKRGWKKMNVAWGKRRNAGQYMNRAGSWGKREPNWNNLKGMWGKRAITTGMSRKRAATKGEQWNYLRGSWGKRSAQFPESN